MSKKNKLTLDVLKVQSFVTEIKSKIYGGLLSGHQCEGTDLCTEFNCPTDGCDTTGGGGGNETEPECPTFGGNVCTDGMGCN